MIDDVISSKSSQWYSKLKRLSNFDLKPEIIRVEQISQLSEQAQAEAIADNLSSVSNQYQPLQRDQITIPPFTSKDVPYNQPYKVRDHLEKIKINKATVPGDIPARIIKEFAVFLCIPVADIINSGIQLGQWPKVYKHELMTPVPKQFPPDTIDRLRLIANLVNLNKIMEQIISQMLISDMMQSIDKKQFGNQKHLGIQHYLVRLLDRILKGLDKNSKGEINAALLLFIDYKQAFSRQCHTLGIQSFINNNVRPSLIPILMSYFEDRQMRVRWNGTLSKPRGLPGGGAMGQTLGIWEYLSQTNNNADCVPEEDRFKFVDDLTVLEIINLLSNGLSSFNVHSQVPSDIPVEGMFVNSCDLKSQSYLQQINEWSDKHQMILSKQKTKAMIVNFTDNYQFSTRLKLNNENIQIVDKMKLLGTWVNNKLTWDDNCAQLVRKVNTRMQLLRNVLAFGAKRSEMTHLWKVFCRSILETSCVVWHNSLSQENIEDLERTQKSFAKLLLKKEYKNYPEALIKLNLESLIERRENMALKFAKDGIKNGTLLDLFPKNKKEHNMKMRETNIYQVEFANTERLKNSGVIYLQNLLNKE